jgi:signal transduction histidine kinase
MESVTTFQSAPTAIPMAGLPVMSVVTHELRSPVKVTSSLLNVLSRGYVGELNDRQADLVDRARMRIQALEKLIDDLLDLAAGKAEGPAEVEHSPIPLSEVLHEVCVRYEPVAREKGLWVKYSGLNDGLTVSGDRDELDRIFNNLVGNAVKYTERGGVEVRAERVDGWIRVTVTDTGIGIPDDALPQLFQEFFRASNAKATGESGTGLGLAIVKDLVERYGGRVEVESEEGVGTSFCILMPAASE